MTALVAEIEADERLGYYMDTAAASGNLKRYPHRRHIRDLQRQSVGPRRRHAQETITRSDAPAATSDPASFGIEVVYVDADGTEIPRPGQAVSGDG